MVLPVNWIENFTFFKIFKKKKLHYWKFWKKWNFQFNLQPKPLVLWKKIPEINFFKKAQIFKWNHFHAKKIIFGHFRAKNAIWKKMHFLAFFCKIWELFFKQNFFKPLKKKFFFLKKKMFEVFPGFSSIKKY